MRKLVESTFVTLDGVIGDPQVWGMSYWDAEHNEYARRLLFSADALLLGRKTYEGFAQAWPERAGSSDFADRFNELPKYVASRTLPAGEAEGDATAPAGATGEGPAPRKEQRRSEIMHTRHTRALTARPLLNHRR